MSAIRALRRVVFVDLDRNFVGLMNVARIPHQGQPGMRTHIYRALGQARQMHRYVLHLMWMGPGSTVLTLGYYDD